MNLGEILLSALRGVTANKLRSILTLLGVMIGVGSVILLLAVGNGSAAEVKSAISDLGTNTLTVRSTNQGGGRFSSPVNSIFGVTSGGGETIFAAASDKDVVLQIGANVTPTGGGRAHNNMQPFLVLNYMIALQGTYPSRQ